MCWGHIDQAMNSNAAQQTRRIHGSGINQP